MMKKNEVLQNIKLKLNPIAALFIDIVWSSIGAQIEIAAKNGMAKYLSKFKCLCLIKPMKLVMNKTGQDKNATENNCMPSASTAVNPHVKNDE